MIMHQKAVFILLLKQWFWKLTYTVDIGKARREKTPRYEESKTAAQERRRIYKLSCIGKSSMEERIEIYWFTAEYLEAGEKK